MSAATLLVVTFSSAASAPGPWTKNSPMCETSKTPAVSLTRLCSLTMPAYMIGISYPANSTIRAPADTCLS